MDLELQIVDLVAECSVPTEMVEDRVRTALREHTPYLASLPSQQVVVLHGVAADGTRAVVHVYGFCHHIFLTGVVPGPALLDTLRGLYAASEEARQPAWKRRKTDQEFDPSIDGAYARKGQTSATAIAAIMGVMASGQLTNLCDADAGPAAAVKVLVASKRVATTLAELVLKTNLPACVRDPARQAVTVYEAQTPPDIRFSLDVGLRGGAWVTLAGARSHAFFLRQDACEVHLHLCDLTAHDPLAPGCDPRHAALAPFRILSFDIECAPLTDRFPDADQDPVIQIGVVARTGLAAADPVTKSIHVLGGCSTISGVQVTTYATERALLDGFAQSVLNFDPDFVTGYNIFNFDFPYLSRRAEVLGASKLLKIQRGRTTASPSANITVRKVVKTSNQSGTVASHDILIEGRIVVDMFRVAKEQDKLPSYTLNAIAKRFLNDQKEDVPPRAIRVLHAGTDMDRARIATYCVQDAHLPLRLLDHFLTIYSLVEMARVTGVAIRDLITKAQAIKVLAQIWRAARPRGMLVPYLGGGAAAAAREEAEDFEGATVIEPKRGLYTDPIATLDFASLYPSIMMANNLCYSTRVAGAPLGPHLRCPGTGARFYTAAHRKGLLPEILEVLVATRKKTRLELERSTDPVTRQVLNQRQLALKVSANSVYGFTGAPQGGLPCLDIAASVTGFGREMILMTKDYVERTYTKANGHPHDAVVVYGDTDSVMVLFGPIPLATAMTLGKEAADAVSVLFPKPVKLEFEKCYHPYLLCNKKRYAGMLWENVDKPKKMDVKGLEVVRRDNSRLIRETLATCLDCILRQGSIVKAQDHVRAVVARLLTGRVDVSRLVVTKSLSRASYATAQVHDELAKRMQRRDPGSAPKAGDRVPYIMVDRGRNTKTHEKSEHPTYAVSHDLPIDTEYYLERLRLAVLRIFDGIIPNPESALFSGDHMRTIVRRAPNTASGAVGMARFVVPVQVCINCGTPLTASHPQSAPALCPECSPAYPLVVRALTNEAALAELQFNELWSQCQACTRNVCSPIICEAYECPVYFAREENRRAVVRAHNNLARVHPRPATVVVPDW